MGLEIEVKKLVSHINSCGLQIPVRNPPYEHVGSIIADAVLQVGHRWKTHVGPRLERMRDKYPTADTISGVSELLETDGAQELLDWHGEDELERFSLTVRFFEKEQIETFSQLRKWLESDNRDRLITKSSLINKAGISKIANATADYYRVLVGLPDAVKVDTFVQKFLVEAGILKKRTYEEKRSIVQLAARQLHTRPIDLDGAIWKYEEKQKKIVFKTNSIQGDKSKMSYEYFTSKQAYDFSIGKGYQEEVSIIQKMQLPQQWNQAQLNRQLARNNGTSPLKQDKASPWWLKRAIIGANILLWECKKIPGCPGGRQPGAGWISNRKNWLYKYLNTPEGTQWHSQNKPYWC